MDAPCQGTLARVFIGSDELYEGKPLYEAIVLKARDAGLAGANVIKAVMGFGRDRQIRSAKLLTISTNLPLVIEIVDSEGRMKAFLPELLKMAGGALVTVERIEVLQSETGNGAGHGTP